MDCNPTSNVAVHAESFNVEEGLSFHLLFAVMEKWVSTAGDWSELTVKQRKAFLLKLRNSKDKLEEAVQYVTQRYPGWSVEDLEGNESLLVHLSTPLAVKVMKEHCSVPFSLACVPSLMKQRISSSTLEKILKASKEKTVGKSRKVAAAAAAVATNSVGGIQAECTNGIIQADGVQPESYQPTSEEVHVKEIINTMMEKEWDIRKWDRIFLQILSTRGPVLNLNDCRTVHGNVLHIAAKLGLDELAKEVLAQGYYNMLLEKDDDNKWPLYYAVEKKKWLTVKIILDTLKYSHKQVQMKVVKAIVPSQDIINEVRRNQKPGGRMWAWWVWWVWRVMRVCSCSHLEDIQMPLKWSTINSENMDTKKEMEGKVLLLKAVLDTAMQGNDVDPSILLKYCSENVDNIGNSRSGGESTNETGGSPAKQSRTTLFDIISDCNIEEFQCHPCFATVVEHKWRNGYGLIHGLLFVVYMAYLVCFTMSLGLASRSSDPREYSGRLDPLRLICEMASFLYLIITIVMECTLILFNICCTTQNWEILVFHFFKEEVVSVYNWFEVLRYTSTLLIIPLRIADNLFQWQMAALAIILSGFKLFRYAAVLPYLESYVGTLFLLLWQDLPRLVGVFVVINFSLGSGVYFALVGHYDGGNVDIVNNNSTSELYLLWLTGVRLLVEGSVLTYIGQDGFNFSGVIIYWMLVFCVSTVFTAILIAQFNTSFKQLAEKASVTVILNKTYRIQKMDELLELLDTVLICAGCIDEGTKRSIDIDTKTRLIQRTSL